MAREPERGSVRVEGAAIEVLTWGEVGAPGLLFAHGYGAHADWWSFVAPLFADHWRVAAVSNSGNGASDWRADYTVAQHAREALAVAQAAGLCAAGPPIMVGHSYGGIVGMQLAMAAGERLAGLVTIDTPVRPPDVERTPLLAAKSATPRIYSTVAEALARFRLAPPQACDNLFILDFVARRALKPVNGGWSWRFDPRLVDSLGPADSQPMLRGPLCPLALLYGERSPMMDARVRDYMQALAPSGTPMIGVPDADHHVPLDQPLALAALLRGLFARWPACEGPGARLTSLKD